MENINVASKDSDLISSIETHFQGKINLARVKFISFFVIALTKVRTVNFESLARAFDTEAEVSSNLRRIQRFISGYSLDSNIIAKLIFALLPVKTDLILTIERTNWKFGKTDINIFMLGVVYQGVAFPLLFSMLPKKGNSNSKERIALIDRYISLFGKDTIKNIVADREFVGQKWIKYLNDNNLKYYIRVRNNFKVYIPKKNKEVKAFWLFNSLKTNHFHYYSNIEKKHLSDTKRIEKLILLVMIAFVWAYKVGIYIHKNIKQIIVKKHGRKAKTIFKTGLDYITNYFLNSKYKANIDIFKFLSCT